MQISDRLRQLTPDGDDGWGVYYKAIAMQRGGIEILNLTIGEHDIGTDPSILRTMNSAALGGHTGYAEVPGIPELRQAVANRTEQNTGVPTGPENVLITPGGQAALFAAHMLACNPGDKALFLDPYYVTYPGTIRGAGAIPVPVQTRPEDGFQPRASDIAARSTRAASLLINTPNNPTGAVYTRNTLDGIAQVCVSSDLWLISDEVYDSQVWSGQHLSPRALPGMAERTLVAGSLSKSHAMTGSRLGWIIGPDTAISALANLSTHTTYGVPGYIQDAGLFALSKSAELEPQIAAPFKRRRDLALHLLAQQSLIRPVDPNGAMYVMLDIRPTGLTAPEFCTRLLEQEHIATLPGDSFGQAAKGHIRVALTLPDDLLETALTRLLAFAQGQAQSQAQTQAQTQAPTAAQTKSAPVFI